MVKNSPEQPKRQSEPETAKIMLFGSPKAVASMIHALHSKKFAEVNSWSKPQPTQNPQNSSEVVSVLIKRVSIKPELRQPDHQEYFRDWSMFGAEGNAAVTQMMEEIRNALHLQPLPEVRRLLHQRMRVIARNHEEIYDTAVREIITHRLTQWACSTHNLEIDSDFWDL